MRLTRRTALAAAASLAAADPLFAVGATQAPQRKLRLLILGGTGFTGPHQVRYALSRGHQVTVFNRGREAVTWPGAVEALTGDRSTGDLKALEGKTWDVCIDNPATLPFWVRDAGKMLAGRVGQYILISSLSAYAANDRPGADETAPLSAFPGGGDPLLERKVALELFGPLKAASELEAERQFPGKATVIRPGLIVGPGDQTDRFTYWPVRLARGGEVLAPGDGSDPVQFIDARDLAEWTVRLAEQGGLGPYNAIGPRRPITMRALLESVGRGVGVRPALTWAPDAFLATNKVSPWSDMPVWIPSHGEDSGFHRRSTARAVAAGLTTRAIETTAAETLAWFREQPSPRQAQLRAGISPAREAELLAQLKSLRS